MTIEDRNIPNGEVIKKEIRDLHQFFEDYFLGKIDKTSIEILDKVLSDNFNLISPTGSILSKDQIIDLVNSGYNSTKERKIWVEDIKTRNVGNLIIAQYYELQRTTNEKSKRISTAIFSYSSNMENHCKWELVHETLCD